jgi:hypothetical protein
MTKTHGMANTKLYRAWFNMKKRVNNPSKHDGENYKNINYCNEWNKFEPFMEWALSNGYKEELTLDRINVHGNYEPSNCRWITQKHQQRNKTNTKWITYQGKTQSLADWAEQLGYEMHTLKSRFLRGWEVERAFTEPLGEGRRSAIQTRLRDERGRIT